MVGEQYQFAIPEPRPAASVVQQHHRQQTVHLRLVGHQLGERPPESERLGRHFAAATVALVEDQVDDRQHGGEPIGQWSGGTRNGIPAALILRFARTSR